MWFCLSHLHQHWKWTQERKTLKMKSLSQVCTVKPALLVDHNRQTANPWLDGGFINPSQEICPPVLLLISPLCCFLVVLLHSVWNNLWVASIFYRDYLHSYITDTIIKVQDEWKRDKVCVGRMPSCARRHFCLLTQTCAVVGHKV